MPKETLTWKGKELNYQTINNLTADELKELREALFAAVNNVSSRLNFYKTAVAKHGSDN